ncbi:DUF6193 family natural product biosynthesis protein [Streptomyces sp. JB150]|uniref:DUF6193 family natural product biosynthesis protein n=1 Tax=Streptomyces sp. JB150 TaxID=2714844 RepID=UPI00140D7ED0|nr:DUF6193 family natural product biosynthesis protein [Streptomyces sp. JB150]QIJ62700.1 hypothetical protein G7Z13_12115 [Streptomyces sp. JB150]
MPTPSDPAVLYPEVAARGSLAAALRAEAERRPGHGGVPFRASDHQPLLHATAESLLPHRAPLEISASRHERRWSIRGTEPFQGMPLVDGGTADLAQLAAAARAWHDGTALDGIRRAAPFVHLTGRIETPDPDPALMAESEWQGLRRQAEELEYVWRDTHRALIEAAYAQPALRALYPFTSHWALRFSVTTRPDLTVVGPHLAARSDGRYGVGRSMASPDLGVFATAREAVAVAVRHLPSGLGPVRLGG